MQRDIDWQRPLTFLCSLYHRRWETNTRTLRTKTFHISNTFCSARALPLCDGCEDSPSVVERASRQGRRYHEKRTRGKASRGAMAWEVLARELADMEGEAEDEVEGESDNVPVPDSEWSVASIGVGEEKEGAHRERLDCQLPIARIFGPWK
jgi:hypothetical protein